MVRRAENYRWASGTAHCDQANGTLKAEDLQGVSELLMK